MGDQLGGVNGDLPLPNGTRTDIFDERDDRPAAYLLATIGDSEERATLTLGALDNGGDQDEPGVWSTQLATIGATLRPHPNVDVVLQYLDGEARVRAVSNDSDLEAYYGLVSLHLREHRFTVRYDDFRVEDVDGGNPNERTRRRIHGGIPLSLAPEAPDRARVRLARQRKAGRRAVRAVIGRMAGQLPLSLLKKLQLCATP